MMSAMHTPGSVLARSDPGQFSTKNVSVRTCVYLPLDSRQLAAPCGPLVAAPQQNCHSRLHPLGRSAGASILLGMDARFAIALGAIAVLREVLALLREVRKRKEE